MITSLWPADSGFAFRFLATCDADPPMPSSANTATGIRVVNVEACRTSVVITHWFAMWEVGCLDDTTGCVTGWLRW